MQADRAAFVSNQVGAGALSFGRGLRGLESIEQLLGRQSLRTLRKTRPEFVPDRECAACGSDLRQRGLLVAAEPLQPVETATTVRVRNGRVTVTDGPFAETKEQLAGFYLIEARDLNDAIQVAARIPPAREGSIEVRPLRELGADAVEPGSGRTGEQAGVRP